jgi:hypothetical protein
VGQVSRKIAIVGNGSFDRRDAVIIDACDLVVRFNDCRSVGEGGLRTDVVAVCNTGRPALSMVQQRSWREHVAVSSACELWCVRDTEKFAELKGRLGPNLDDFCDDYTAEFLMFAVETGKAFKVIPRVHHDRIDVELRKMTSDHYVVPSSGLMAITYVLDEEAGRGNEILLAGFDHCGWSGHPFDAERLLIERQIDAERLLIERQIADGRLRRIAASPSRGSSCLIL